MAHRIPLIPLTLLFITALNPLANACDMALNHGFESEDTMLWTETGTIPYQNRGVVRFNVTGSGLQSWAYYQHPGWDYYGGVQQTIYVEAGVTYVVSADVCYHSG